ncbi:MAG: CapA family protein [Nitrospirota bacterium]
MKKTIVFLVFFFFVISSLNFVSAEDKESDIVFLAVGDIMLSRYIGKVMAVKGNDYPFEKVMPFLRKGDIVFGNLESVISANYNTPFFPEKPYNFLASPDIVKTLRDAGFTVFNIANNHAMDYGPAALLEMRQLLKDSGIDVFGAGKDLEEARCPAVITVNGLRLAILGYGVAHSNQVYAGHSKAGILPVRLDYIRKDIQTLRSKVDFLIVSLHWGKEYERFPTEDQRRIAHLVIDWGADMILGHHPHVLQGIELYKDKMIVYSLGNFLFDQKGNGTDGSIILACRFKDKVLHSMEVIPLDRFRAFFPKVAEGSKKEEILGDLKRFSLPLNSDPAILKDIGL